VRYKYNSTCIQDVEIIETSSSHHLHTTHDKIDPVDHRYDEFPLREGSALAVQILQ
jgi:hypothetical protein